MGLAQRLSLIFKAKASKALDKAEDPRETLDYSYQRQMELLQQVRRATADVATARKRIELQAEKLQQSATKLEDQARQAVASNREDLAREALTRRSAIAAQLADLKAQHDQLVVEESKLVDNSKRLEAKIESFRTRKEMVKATYSAAEAQARIGEAVSGISEEMGDIGLAMQRAEDKTAQMQARAGALDELLASGSLDDLSAPTDNIQAELNRMSATSGVDAELARLKGELGTSAKSLEAAAEELPAPAQETAARDGAQ